ncbi:MAG: peptidoglycan DD-metalloendopeptidase family protein [Gemmatimonadota bacterium]|nr:MAG: peptidoglycan DD-metalloendopeptidase family protein [Gemmatimonadota bacterium]
MIRMQRKLLWSSLLHVSFACALLAQQADIDEKITRKEGSLKEIRAQIEACRQELDQLHGVEMGILDSLQIAEQELTLVRTFLSRLNSRQKELKKEIDLVQTDFAATQERLEILRRKLALRLRDIYKRRRGEHPLETLMTAASPVTLFRQYKYLHAAAETDKTILLEVERDQVRLEKIQVELETKHSENRKLLLEKEQEEKRVKILQSQRRRHLEVVRTQVSVSTQAMKELEEEAKLMATIIARLEKERRRILAQKQAEGIEVVSGDFAQYRGQLPWPTKGHILSTFGPHRHPIFKTTTLNKGIDIQAPYGSHIFAVASGNVIMIDWLRGYGKFLIIDHQCGYYTLYAHASEIFVEENDHVMGGEIIAKVGDTGSLQGAMLHFEIREGKNEVDPMLWLRKE